MLLTGEKTLFCRSSVFILCDQSDLVGNAYFPPFRNSGCARHNAAHFNPSTWKTETGRSVGVSGQPGLRSTFQTNQVYIMRTYRKISINRLKCNNVLRVQRSSGTEVQPSMRYKATFGQISQLRTSPFSSMTMRRPVSCSVNGHARCQA